MSTRHTVNPAATWREYDSPTSSCLRHRPLPLSFQFIESSQGNTLFDGGSFLCG